MHTPRKATTQHHQPRAARPSATLATCHLTSLHAFANIACPHVGLNGNPNKNQLLRVLNRFIREPQKWTSTQVKRGWISPIVLFDAGRYGIHSTRSNHEQQSPATKYTISDRQKNTKRRRTGTFAHHRTSTPVDNGMRLLQVTPSQHICLNRSTCCSQRSQVVLSLEPNTCKAD